MVSDERKQQMKRRVVYAEANYAALVHKRGYFVDKTNYIAELETVENPVFLRPRRFGKSLLCTMLGYDYYPFTAPAVNPEII